MDSTFRKLQQLRDATVEINKLLYEEEWEQVLDKLSYRQDVLQTMNAEDLQVRLERAKLGRENSATISGIKAIIQSIISLDARNTEVLQTKINRTARSLAEVAKEKRTIKDLRSMAQMAHKQIVDFIY
ncbi:MAG: hypothetical protein ACE5IY_08350 [bacterium]